MNKCMELFNQTYYFEFKKTILPCLYEMLTNQNSKLYISNPSFYFREEFK